MTIGWAIAMMVASMVISIALTPSPAKPKAATYDDMNIPQVEDGTPQAVFFGECWSGDWQVIAYGGLATTPIKASNAKK